MLPNNKTVTKIRALTNTSDEGDSLYLIVGKVYRQTTSGAIYIDSDCFYLTNENNDWCKYKSKYFEVVEVKQNTGFEIKCKDCGERLSISNLKENSCPRCGQIIIAMD